METNHLDRNLNFNSRSKQLQKGDQPKVRYWPKADLTDNTTKSPEITGVNRRQYLIIAIALIC